MKHLIFTLLFSIAVLQLNAQCWPVFSPMDVQPPATPKGYYLSEPYNNENGFLFLKAFTTDSNGMNHDIFHYWDGKIWNSLPKLNYIGYNHTLVNWKDTFVVYGQFDSLENIKFPDGKKRFFLQCINGKWDTMPGEIISPNDFLNRTIISGQNGLYSIPYPARAGTDSIDFQLYRGTILKYNAAQRRFEPFLVYESHYPNTYLLPGKERLLISGIEEINGKKTEGFAYWENNTLYTNADTSFKLDFSYTIDPETDHIFASNNSFTPAILEYSNKLIQTRNTGKIAPYPNNSVEASKGRLFSVADDANGNTYISILCPNETKWKIIFQPYNDQHWQGRVSSTITGTYQMNYKTQKIDQLTEGATIEGTAYVDLNANCQLDTKEPLLKNVQITAASKNFSTATVTDQHGHYELYVTPDTFKFSCPAATSCDKDKVLITSASSDFTRDYAMSKPGFLKLSGIFTSGSIVRWNSETDYVIDITNLGDATDSAGFEIQLDSRVQIISADAGITYKNNIATGLLKNLGYFDKRTIYLQVWIDSAATKPGDTICNRIKTHLFRNNTDSISEECQLVAYSFDPNHKSCNKDSIPPRRARTLTYTIDFQNEGNDDAYDVVISDPLSNNLNIKSFQFIAASHPYTFSINEGALKVTFKDIHLTPETMDEKLSKGYFKFSISTQEDLEDQTVIPNTAYIFFDLNTPVITNTCQTLVSETYSSVSHVLSSKKTMLGAYPNPSSGNLSITSLLSGELYIYNAEGRIMSKIPVTEGITNIDVSNWAAGIYFLRCGNASCKVIRN